MTDFAGVVFNGDIARADPTPPRANQATHPNGVAFFFQDAAAALDAPKSENRPVAVLHRDLSGAYTKTYYFDYYDRVWMIPGAISLGAVTADVHFDLKAWNAFSIPNTLTDAVLSGIIDNTTLSGLPIGSTVKPLQLVDIFVNVAGSGAPSIDAHVLLSWSEGGVTDTPISGVRAFLWDYAFWPNWRDPVRVSYTFKTEIIRSRRGNEQRRSLMSHPRKQIEFTVTAIDSHTDRHRSFRRLMQRSQNLTFVVPEWPRRVALATAFPAGDVSFDVESVPTWLVTGRQIVLTDGESASVFQVQNIVGNAITVTSISDKSYAAGDVLIAGVTGRLEDKITGNLRASFVSEHAITFKAYPGEEPAASFDLGDVEQLFDGREIMPFRPNWLRDPSLDMIWPTEEVDHGFGVIDRYRVQPFPQQLFKGTFLSTSVEDAERKARFFWRAQGMRGEFFVPTFENDFALREPSPVGLDRIRLIGTEPYDAYQVNSETFRCVLIRQLDGTLAPMKIQSVAEVNDSTGNDTLISFTEPLTVAVGPETSTVDWLLLARFASDILTLGWETVEVAQVEMAFETQPYQESE